MKHLLTLTVSLGLTSLTNAQSITSVKPSWAVQGQTLTVTITGANTQFISSSATTVEFNFLPAPAIINYLNPASDTVLEANITVPVSTKPGNYPVSLFGYSYVTLTWQGLFQVLSDTPVLKSVVPSTANIGQTLDVTITGFNTQFVTGGELTVQFNLLPEPAIINSISASSDTVIQTNITIPVNTAPGNYSVQAYGGADNTVTWKALFAVTASTSIGGPAGADDVPLVYPNPNQGEFTIMPGAGETITEIILYDQTGRRIKPAWSHPPGATSLVVKLDQNVMEGVYILQMITSKGARQIKLVVD